MACQCEKGCCGRLLHGLPVDTAGKVQRAAHVNAVSRSAHTAAAGVGLPLLSLRAPWLGPRPRPQDAGG